MPRPIVSCSIPNCEGERLTINNPLCAMHNWRKKRYGDPLHKRPGTRGPNIPPDKRTAIHAWVRALDDLGRAREVAARLGLEVHTVEVEAHRYRHRVRNRG